MNRTRFTAVILAILMLFSFCALSSCSGEYLETETDKPKDTATSPGLEQVTESAPLLPPEAAGILTVRILKTGESDCILLTLNGENLLIDTADYDDQGTILSTLQSAGVKKIDTLIITHLDSDHIGSAPAILSAMPVARIYTPNYTRVSSYYTKLTSAASTAGVPLTMLTEDITFSFGGATVAINVPAIFPAETPEAPGLENDEVEAADGNYGNNHSLITAVSYGSKRLLFLGDAEKDRMADFNTAGLGTYDFIKLPHHGGYDKALKSLIDTAGAAYAVECVKNRTDVTATLLSRLEAIGTKLYVTGEGTVTVCTDGNTLEITQ